MKFTKTELAGVVIIDAEPFEDDRGIFRRHFDKREFAQNGIVTDVVQCNVSENKYAHTLRGFHYQITPHGEGKTLSCFKGAVYDVVIDLRPESSTYKKWISVELTEENRKSLHIPPGCANAFFTLRDTTVVHYYVSEWYAPEAERGIRYDDPAFNITWPAPVKIISDKDSAWPNFEARL